MKGLKKRKSHTYIPRRERLTPLAYFLIRMGLRVSCAILAAALLFGVYLGGLTVHNIKLHMLLADLYRAPMGILLITSLGALIVEDSVR